MLWSGIPHLGNKSTWEGVGRGVRGKGWRALAVPSAATEAETACLMTAEQRIVYRPPQQKPLAYPSPATEFALYLRQQESGSALQAY